MSEAAYRRVSTDFDAGARARAYQALFRQWRERRRSRPQRSKLPYGSRLDQPWIPNPLVRTVRTAVRRLHGKP